MTLPDERYRAVIQARMFLVALCKPEQTPRVPKIIREHARMALRHFPTNWDMEETASKVPELFQKELEPLYKMVKQYQQEQDKSNSNTVCPECNKVIKRNL